MSSVVISGDTSGAITLAAPTVAGTNTITLPASTGSMALTTGQIGFKNRIINGAMVIDQRNAGASVTPTAGQYTLDRWVANVSQASKFSVQQNAGSVTPPVGFTNYLGVTSLSAYSIGAGDYFSMYYQIEGYNVADLGWGTANAKTVTLSFQVYSSLTGTFGGVFQNSASDRSYPFTYSIPTANTWTTISVTIAGDTSGTWLKTNGIGISIKFSLGTGSTYSGTAGSWSGVNYQSATGATSVVGTSGATFYITGVQLEIGSAATTFDFRSYGTELALCQRYYTLIASGSGKDISASCYYSSTQMGGNICLPVQMRTNPSLTSVTGTNYYINYANNGTDLVDVIVDGGAASLINCSWYNNTQASGTSGAAGFIRTYNAASYVAVSAEL
jgi:hypothetical protein